ncbi:MAG: hypothetical protein V3571_06865 [Pseudodesulfovibrio sp.]
MSKKTQLPDELLDALSGGVFTYQGQGLTRIGKIGPSGIEAETAQGRMFFPWSDKAREDFKGGFGVDQMKAMMAGLDFKKQYALEEYAGAPSPVNE